MRGTFSRAATALGGALLLLVGVLLVLLPGKGDERAGSAFSTDSGGLRAAFLLLEGLGFSVATWSDAPGQLAGRGELLFLGALPPDPPAGPPAAQAEGAETHTPARRSRDLLHYRRFLDAGGTLLLTGVGDEALEFVRDELEGEFSVLESVASTSDDRTLELALGETLELEKAPERTLVPPPDAGAEVLARTGDGSVVALSLALGAGRLVLLTLPSATFDNESLESGDAARLLVRLVEALPGVERILFDEYALGGWQPDSPLVLAFSPRLAWWSAHVLLVFALLFWRSVWAGPFARDPEPLLAVSALARAQGVGRILARAGRFDTLALLLTQGKLERWAARAGLHLAAVAPGERLEPAVIEACLRALARGDERLLARAHTCFLERVPEDEGELAELDQELGALELELFRRHDGRKTPRGIGTRRARTGS